MLYSKIDGRTGYFCTWLLILLAAVISSKAAESGQPVVKTYRLDVGIYPDTRTDYAGFLKILQGVRPDFNKKDSVKAYPHIRGHARMRVKRNGYAGDTLYFYLHGELRAHRIWSGEDEITFRQERVFYPYSYSMTANRIAVKVPGKQPEYLIDLHYGGMLNPSYEASPSDYMRIDTEGAYLRAYGYSLWFPLTLESGSDPGTVDFERVRITTPSGFRAVFTGSRLSETERGNLRISTWRALDVNLFDAGLNVRRYQVTEDRGIHLFHLGDSESQNAGRDILAFVNRLRDFFTENYREMAPGGQLHIAQLPNFASGIGNGNAIGLTSGQWHRFSTADDDTAMERLVAHELVHFFVQPEIGLASPMAALFLEGFPSYFHLPALAEIIGEEWYRGYMRTVEKSYLTKKKTGKTRRGRSLPEEKPILSLTFGDIGEYKDTFVLNDRVGLFLDYLRRHMGVDDFRIFTRRVCHSRNLTPETFQALILEFLPDREAALHCWLYTSEYPEHFHTGY